MIREFKETPKHRALKKLWQRQTILKKDEKWYSLDRHSLTRVNALTIKALKKDGFIQENEDHVFLTEDGKDYCFANFDCKCESL